MGRPRLSFSVRRLMVMVVLIGLSIEPSRWIWTWYGGTLPPLGRFRGGMTKEKGESIFGPPGRKGRGADGSSYMTNVRPGSFYWGDLDLDPAGRLRVFLEGCF